MKQMMMKLLGMATLAGALAACHTTTVVSDPYYHAWYDVYGNYCGNGYPMSGCNFYSNGTKITMNQDPYYASGHTLINDFWTYTDSYGYRRSYTGFAWLSSTGILYDSMGNALNELEEDASSNDLITEAAGMEKASREAAGRLFSQKYALNEEKGLLISKTLQDWAKIGKDRARTDEDVADFAKRLYGVDSAQAEKALAEAMISRDAKAVESLNVDVAAHWGTTPEVSKEILKSWYRSEAQALGL
jgi:hypothetical protein